MSKVLNVVTIGGGTGHYILLCALKLIPKINITAIVSMVDSGGSTGRLRDRYGALPPGDVLQCLLAFSEFPGDVARTLLRQRFSGGKLEGDNAGNWLLTALHQITGDFVQAIRYVEQILKVREERHVLPVTVGSITLHGRSRQGKEVHGETCFDTLADFLGTDDQIKEVWLEPNALMLGEAARAVRQADYVVLSPGDLFSSVIPVLLVQGMKEALEGSQAKLIYVCNMMTRRGQTDGFTVPDCVEAIEQHLPRRLDTVLYHDRGVDDERERRYAETDQAYPVEIGDLSRLDGRELLGSDYLARDGLVRHAPRQVARILGICLGRLLQDDLTHGRWTHGRVAAE